MRWKKILWGVEFKGSLDEDPPMLLGNLWHWIKQEPYPDEPTRALLFCTRAAARRWCRESMDKYKGRADCCAAWRFRPVRVVETVKRASC